MLPYFSVWVGKTKGMYITTFIAKPSLKEKYDNLLQIWWLLCASEAKSRNSLQTWTPCPFLLGPYCCNSLISCDQRSDWGTQLNLFLKKKILYVKIRFCFLTHAVCYWCKKKVNRIQAMEGIKAKEWCTKIEAYYSPFKVLDLNLSMNMHCSMYAAKFTHCLENL